MDKELCLKFLVHLHRFSTSVAQKTHIDDSDLAYINNEVENFRRKIDPSVSAVYDKAGALAMVEKIELETAADKAVNVGSFLIKAKFNWLALLLGVQDDAHVQRQAKVSAFRERVKKVIALIEYAT